MTDEEREQRDLGASVLREAAARIQSGELDGFVLAMIPLAPEPRWQSASGLYGGDPERLGTAIAYAAHRFMSTVTGESRGQVAADWRTDGKRDIQ